MSRWRPERLALALDAALLASAGQPLAATSTGWDARLLGAALLPLLAGGRVQARLLLCPDLCKHFVQQAPAGLRSMAELRQLAATRASRLFGGVAEGWAVVADWSLSRPFVCAALPAAMLRTLRVAAPRLDVESAVLVALEQVLPLAPGDGFLAWASPGHLVLVRRASGQVVGLRCTRRPADLSADELAAWVGRDVAQEGLRIGAAGGKAGADGAVWLAWQHAPLPAAQPGQPEAAWASRLALRH